MTLPRKALATALAAAALAVGVAACGSSGSSSTTATTTLQPAATKDGVYVTNPWARASAGGQTTGAVYVTIESDSGDRLVGASVPTSVAAQTQIHETVVADTTTTMDMGSSSSSMDSGSTTSMDMSGTGGAMTMKQVSGVDIPAGGTVTFQPGGYHIMLLDLVKPLTVGESIPLTLTFQKAGEISVQAQVRAN